MAKSKQQIINEQRDEISRLRRFLEKISKAEDKRFKSCGYDEQIDMLAKQALKEKYKYGTN